MIHKNFRVEASKAGHKVDTCPETKDLWESRAASESASCGGVSEYHCLRDKDGKKRELCLEKTRILQGRNTKFDIFIIEISDKCINTIVCILNYSLRTN